MYKNQSAAEAAVLNFLKSHSGSTIGLVSIDYDNVFGYYAYYISNGKTVGEKFCWNSDNKAVSKTDRYRTNIRNKILNAANGSEDSLEDLLVMWDLQSSSDINYISETVHELKCWPEYFDATAAGNKTFELRLNDRGYKVGDVLILKRFDPATEKYTGEKVKVKISYMLEGPCFGLASGFAILSYNSMETL